MGISWVPFLSFFPLSATLFIETWGAHKEAQKERERDDLGDVICS